MSLEEFIAKKQFEAYTTALRVEVVKVSDLRELVKGKVLLPIEPKITNEMKAEHIGEYSIQFPLACHECEAGEPEEICGVCNGEGQYMHEINIPWDTCKRIYKAMYATAVKQSTTGAKQ